MKNPRRFRLVAGLAFVCAVAGAATAQDASTPGHAPPVRRMSPMPAGAQDAAQVKFEPLAGRDANGKVVRLEGVLDLMALHRNPLVDEATWQKATPVLVEWMEDVDRSVIDNLDFVEKLDGGILETTNVMDMNNNRMVMEMMLQFMSIGPASAVLDQKGALTKQQAQVNTNIGNDYLQKMLDEERQIAQEEARALPEGDGRDQHVVNRTSQFIYELMWRDARESYKRQLDEAAPHLDPLIDQLKLPGGMSAEVKDAARKVKAAPPGEARRTAMKLTLALMPFDKRREMLSRARELAPPFNPRTAYVPPPPEVAAADGAGGKAEAKSGG